MNVLNKPTLNNKYVKIVKRIAYNVNPINYVYNVNEIYFYITIFVSSLVQKKNFLLTSLNVCLAIKIVYSVKIIKYVINACHSFSYLNNLA